MLRRVLTASASSVPTPIITMRNPHLCKNSKNKVLFHVPKRFCSHTRHQHRPEGGAHGAVIGIDFGTSFTRVAALIDGVPQVLTDSEGQRAMPSVVAFLPPPRNRTSEDGVQAGALTPLIGLPALQRSIKNHSNPETKPKPPRGGLEEQATSPVPAACFTGLKQLIGRRFEDPAMQRCLTRRHAPFAIVPCREATATTAIPHAAMREADPRDTDFCMVGGKEEGDPSDGHGGCRRERGGQRFYFPTDLVALILAKAKATAERHLLERRGQFTAAAHPTSHDVPSSTSSPHSASSFSAVLTCPAYFDDAQRYALRQAGQRAGLRVLRVINEPIATVLACLHYANTENNSETAATAEAVPLSHEKVPPGNGIKLNPPNFYVPNGAMVAVYSLGSTFSFTVLQTDSYGLFEVVASCHDEGGHESIGGDTIDRRLASQLLQRQQLQPQHTPSDTIHPRWLAMAAEVKCALSFATEATARLDGAKDLVVTRQALEALSSDLIDRSLERCQQCLEAAALSRSDLAEVVLVGGMAHMPLVRARVTAFFGRVPIGCPFHRDRHDAEERRRGEEDRPDEALALGAVIQGNVVCK